MAVAIAREADRNRPARAAHEAPRQDARPPGEIAVLDHRDLDRVSAEDLIAAGVLAVLNCSPSSTGAYPNMGPLLLVQAGIHLVDLPDDVALQTARRRRPGHGPRRRGRARAEGRSPSGAVQEPVAVRAATDERRREIGDALEAFAQQHDRAHARGARAARPGASSCRASTPTSATGPRSSSCAASTTSRTCGCCAPTSATCARASSPSTAAPTRSSRRASSRT